MLRTGLSDMLTTGKQQSLGLEEVRVNHEVSIYSASSWTPSACEGGVRAAVHDTIFRKSGGSNWFGAVFQGAVLSMQNDRSWNARIAFQKNVWKMWKTLAQLTTPKYYLECLESSLYYNIPLEALCGTFHRTFHVEHSADKQHSKECSMCNIPRNAAWETLQE